MKNLVPFASLAPQPPAVVTFTAKLTAARIAGLAVLIVLSAASCSPAQAPSKIASNAPLEQPTTDSAAVSDPELTARSHKTIMFKSAALGVDKPMIVSLPPGYAESNKRYPVVYMLHGLSGYQESWIKLGIEVAADAVGLEAILVLPDGDDGFYVNWQSPVDYDACISGKRPFGQEPSMTTYCVRKADYGTYLLRDVISHIDQNYRTIPTAEARAIGGLSMGGYGALVTAFRNPDTFVAVASHAGVASLRYVGPDPFIPGKAEIFDDPSIILAMPGFGAHFGKIFGSEISNWIERDPTALVEQLKGRLSANPLAIYIDAGTRDGFRLNNGASHLDEVLSAHGIAHEFHLIEGGRHDASFWRSRIDDSLRFFGTVLATPIAAEKD